MPNLVVVTRRGEEKVIEGKHGVSLMETIREGDIAELLALCGGCCSCATCHVFIDAAWTERVGPAGPDEEALLSGSAHKQATSRLSCQVIIDNAMDGMKVTIAPED